jgi:hypothetical protein
MDNVQKHNTFIDVPSSLTLDLIQGCVVNGHTIKVYKGNQRNAPCILSLGNYVEESSQFYGFFTISLRK